MDTKRLREILLRMFQGIKIDYKANEDRFTGIVTLPDDKIDQAIKEIQELCEPMNQEDIEKILGGIAIPIDTNPMYVEETNNPAVIKLKSTYATIIAKALVGKLSTPRLMEECPEKENE